MAPKLALALILASLLALTATATASAAELMAPQATCPNQTELEAPAAVQEQAMLCMTNFARGQFGEAPLEASSSLEESARDKSRDILQCDSFSHQACGREFTYWMRETGYIPTECWKVGENLAWGTGAYGSVRSIFRAWMQSPEHRANILGEYRQIGIDMRTGPLAGQSRTHVWTQHFGSHCETSA